MNLLAKIVPFRLLLPWCPSDALIPTASRLTQNALQQKIGPGVCVVDQRMLRNILTITLGLPPIALQFFNVQRILTIPVMHANVANYIWHSPMGAEEIFIRV